MDTVYYNLKARRIKVSGGEELVTFVPAPAPAPAGEVLDFARCRRKLERKNAWKSLEQAACAQDTPQRTGWEGDSTLAQGHEKFADSRRAVAEKSQSLGAQRLELATSLAVLLVALSAALAFFSLV